MLQQINLYRTLPTAATFNLTPLLMLQIANLFILLLLLIWGYEKIDNLFISWKFNSLQTQQQTATAELANTTLRYPKAFKNLQLQQENQKITQEIAQKNQLLQNLSATSNSTQYTGFSKYLLGLAKTITPGVWLKQIEIKQSGKEISFIGSATSAPAVMQFLQNLSKQPEFTGEEFKLLQLVHSKQSSDTINFIVSTQTSHQPPSPPEQTAEAVLTPAPAPETPPPSATGQAQ